MIWANIKEGLAAVLNFLFGTAGKVSRIPVFSGNSVDECLRKIERHFGIPSGNLMVDRKETVKVAGRLIMVGLEQKIKPYPFGSKLITGEVMQIFLSPSDSANRLPASVTATVRVLQTTS